MNALQKLAGALFAIMVLFSSAAYALDISVDGPNETVKAKSPSKWRSFRMGELIVRGWNDKLAHGRIAHDRSGNQLPCFTEKPDKLGIAARQIGVIRFEGQKYFCLNGRDEIESLARQKRIQLYKAPTAKTIPVSKLEPKGSCTAASVVGTNASAVVMAQGLASAQANILKYYDEDSEWIEEEGELIELPPEFDLWWAEAMAAGGGAACMARCNQILALLLRFCIGPQAPECVVASGLIYVLCIATC